MEKVVPMQLEAVHKPQAGVSLHSNRVMCKPKEISFPLVHLLQTSLEILEGVAASGAPCSRGLFHGGWPQGTFRLGGFGVQHPW